MVRRCECCGREHEEYFGFLNDMMMVALCPEVGERRIVFIDGEEMPFVRHGQAPTHA